VISSCGKLLSLGTSCFVGQPGAESTDLAPVFPSTGSRWGSHPGLRCARYSIVMYGALVCRLAGGHTPAFVVRAASSCCGSPWFLSRWGSHPGLRCAPRT
jgi:hypothetical protein